LALLILPDPLLFIWLVVSPFHRACFLGPRIGKYDKTVMQDQSSDIISVLQHLVFSFSGLAGMVSTVPQLQTDSILDRFSPQQHLLLHVQPLSL